MGGREIPVVATQLTGPERDRIFRKFADYASNYDAYRHRADRELRVFELTKRYYRDGLCDADPSSMTIGDVNTIVRDAIIPGAGLYTEAVNDQLRRPASPSSTLLMTYSPS